MTIADTGLALTLERDYRIAPERMWELWTTAEHLAAWLKPSLDRYKPSTCEADARVGGTYRLTIPGVTADEPDMTAYGTYLELDPPRTLRFTWGWEDMAPDTTEVIIEIAPTDEGCHLTLTHVRLWDEDQRARHAEGWTGTLESLAALYG
ncbi:SRPBCC family protein [Demequina rhizosphaerae]|uniref:SRPBCC family protein n=1 Tax=Demequina rhizosphaerae TaxID=1638985 RepID=UPI000781EA15|nr:SRPBCC domain-containing protein [Demequina rhizosphaerae]